MIHRKFWGTFTEILPFNQKTDTLELSMFQHMFSGTNFYFYFIKEQDKINKFFDQNNIYEVWVMMAC